MPRGGAGLKSDAEKIELGTFDKRTGQEARDDRKVAKLLAHPRLKEVPEPELPLGERGSVKYNELARMLLEQGQLTIITRGYAENAAIAFEEIDRLKKAGKDVRASLIQQYQRALDSIRQFDIDRPIQTPEGQRKNRFAYSGFSSRLRRTSATPSQD